MATNQTYAQGTLLDVLNGRGPDGMQMRVAEVLFRETPMFRDAKWVEANNATQHTYQIQYSLPSSTRIAFNRGAKSSLGTSRTEVCVLQGRENMPEIDVRLVKIAADGQMYMNQQMKSAITGISQDMETDLLYANKASGDEFNGLAVRLNSTTNRMVFDNGGTGSNLTSLYFVAWDADDGAYLAYPKGSQAGIKAQDMGTRVKDNPDGTKLRVHEMHIEATQGLCVVDERAIGRIANINVGALGKNTFNEDLGIELLNEMPATVRGSTVIYASRKAKAAMDIRANDKGNAYYTRENVFGEPVTMFQGHVVRLDEMISQNESRVVA